MRSRTRISITAFLSAVLLVGLTVSLPATTIIIHTTSAEALLAVDSRRRVKGRAEPVTICKIVATPRAAFTVGGVATAGGQNIHDLLAKFASDDIDATLRKVEPDVKEILKRVDLTPEQVRRWKDGPEAMSAVVAIGLAPQPIARRIAFYLRSSGIDSKPVPINSHEQLVTMSNAKVEAGAAASRELAITPRPSLPSIMRSMMRAASEADSGTAFPITIVRLTSTKGLEWIERGACAGK